MPPARWGPSLQTSAGRQGARPGSLCSPRLLGRSESRLPTCPQRLGRPVTVLPPLQLQPRTPPKAQLSAHTHDQNELSLLPVAYPPPASQAPSCQAGTRPSHPIDDSHAGRGRQAGTVSSPSLALQRLWPSRAKFSISCVSAGRAGQPVASGAFAPQCGPAKHSSGDCPRRPAPRTRSCQRARTPLNREPGRVLPQQRQTPHRGHVSNQTRHDHLPAQFLEPQEAPG